MHITINDDILAPSIGKSPTKRGKKYFRGSLKSKNRRRDGSVATRGHVPCCEYCNPNELLARKLASRAPRLSEFTDENTELRVDYEEFFGTDSPEGYTVESTDYSTNRIVKSAQQRLAAKESKTTTKSTVAHDEYGRLIVHVSDADAWSLTLR